MLPQEIIRKKRDGEALDAAEIDAFVHGLTEGAIGEGQVAAFAMAVFLKGMTHRETVALTRAMTRSGTVLDWRHLPGPVLDKHSTGGVGDKVSLILAPLLAACGGFVPMISGRGLGHTGGTLDKLEAIPGYTVAPEPARFRAVVRDAGCAIIGQTDDLAPADRRLYSIRDVTATVESIPLIVASILSKKLAAGLQALVMDVKTGSGAFARDINFARALAGQLVAIAADAGLPTTALITDMNQVLGTTVGHALEVEESIAAMTGSNGDPRLMDVTIALAADVMALAGLAASPAEGRAKARAALESGAVAERFQRMVHDLGGPDDLVERPARHLARAPTMLPCPPARGGVLAAMDTREIGLAVVELGGGRARIHDVIDHRVGLSDVAPIGATVGPDRPLAMIHARDAATAARAAARIAAACRIADGAPTPTPVVIERVAH